MSPTENLDGRLRSRPVGVIGWPAATVEGATPATVGSVSVAGVDDVPPPPQAAISDTVRQTSKGRNKRKDRGMGA